LEASRLEDGSGERFLAPGPWLDEERSFAIRSPCKSRKAGLLEIRRPPRRHGSQVPLFVNLVCHTRPKLAAPQSRDHVNVLAHGNLSVRKYVGG
jgi:hypothetical protein